MSQRTYKIAEAAAAVGVAAETLRLWEKHGLLPSKRTPAGHRFYDAKHLATAQQIARFRAQDGLSLSEIRTALKGSHASTNGGAGAQDQRADATPGQRLRRLRSLKGVSLAALATTVDVAPSGLSTFERTSQGLSVSVLRRIADFFSVTVTQLSVDPDDTGPAPVRRNEGQRIAALGPGINIRALATGLRSMDCKEWTLAAGAKSDGSYTHVGEEFIFVLAGCLDISVDGIGLSSLTTGDSLYFESTRPHSWSNKGPDDCVVLWINTPPSF